VKVDFRFPGKLLVSSRDETSILELQHVSSAFINRALISIGLSCSWSSNTPNLPIFASIQVSVCRATSIEKSIRRVDMDVSEVILNARNDLLRGPEITFF